MLVSGQAKKGLFYMSIKLLVEKFVERHFPAFVWRNYRLYFIGQTISFAGTWLQATTLGYLVYQLTHSAFYTGLVGSLWLLPGFLLCPLGGMLVDKFERRHVLYVTNFIGLALAILLGGLTIFGHIQIWQIIVISCVLGISTAIDGPARASMVHDIVGDKKHLGSAQSLNGTMINLSQAIGPALVAPFIALFVLFGSNDTQAIGWTFVVNGISFLAVIISMWMMKLPKYVVPHEDPISAGVEYLWKHKYFIFLIFAGGIVAMFGFSYRAILPVMNVKFGNEASILGYLTCACASGAVCGGLLVSSNSRNLPFEKFVTGGCLAMGLSFALLPLANLWMSFVLLAISGAGFMLSFSTIRAVTLMFVDPKMKGRVLGFVFSIFYGGLAFGGILNGKLAGVFGSDKAIVINGLVLLVMSLLLLIFRKQIVPKMGEQRLA